MTSSARAPLLLVLPLLAACTDGADGDDGCVANSAMEIETHELINDHRADMGLGELELDACASEIAREHSEDMAVGAVDFGHDGFEARSEELLVLFPDAFITGENVAMNQGYDEPAVITFQGWLDSPPHRENIELPDYTISGMGVVEDDVGGFWFTHLFVAN